MRQGFEGFGDAEALLGPAWTVAEDSLDVLGEACEAEVQVYVGAQRAQEVASFFAIEARSFLGDTRELFVGALPVEVFDLHSLSIARRFWDSWFARSAALTRRKASRRLAARGAFLAAL